MLISASSSDSEQIEKGYKLYSSAVLIVKPVEAAVNASKIETNVKSKCDIPSINVKVEGTRLVKNGVLIRCSDSNSQDKLKDSLKNLGNGAG